MNFKTNSLRLKTKNGELCPYSFKYINCKSKHQADSSTYPFWKHYFNKECVVATTCRNGTRSMLTSAKLSVGYLVVGITRELNKEPSLYCFSIYINTMWSVLQQYVYLMSYYSSTMLLPQGHHAMSMCPDIILFNLCHHAYTMRNHCPLMSSLILTSSRLFLILLDPKSFQTALDYSTWLPGYVLFFHCRLIINYLSMSS